MSRRRVLGLAALVVATVVVGVSLRTHGAAPEPASPDSSGTVSFDHTIHAGEYGMPCLSCHVYAAQSSSAGLPSARKCMGCHKFAAKDKPAVQALAALFEKGEAPRWQRVTRLPDFIYFSHRMHVRSKIDCAQCHGDVKAMHTVRMVVNMNMGFCIDCHSEHNATVDCVACHK
jgi:hypothetical protein